MPVTKTAKRALRSSQKKAEVNKKIISNLEIAIRTAKKTGKEKDIQKAVSLTDRALKKRIFHRNKTSRIKSILGKLSAQKIPPKGKGPKTVKALKTPKK